MKAAERGMGESNPLLGEAADWLVRLGAAGGGSTQEREAFAAWGRQSPAHAEAWQRAASLQQLFTQVPADIGGQALRGVRPGLGRRQALRLLGAAALVAPTAWLAWREAPWAEWGADLRTATGEQRSVTLADGTRLVLNTGTSVDVRFDERQRLLRLHSGEILLTTGHDPSPVKRPFLVQTAQGTARALGTRFTVRQAGESTRVAVFQGAVELRPRDGDQALVVRAGEQSSIGPEGLAPARPADPASLLWEQGMLVAQDQRLDQLLAELSRYRAGVLRCDPAVAGLRVSGAFPLRDTDASLALLAKTLPLRVRGLTRYWTVVEPL